MPYLLTEEPMLFRLVFFDDITSRDLFSLIDAIVAIERGRLVVPNRLTDLSQIAEALVTFTDMLAFVERPRRIGSPIA